MNRSALEARFYSQPGLVVRTVCCSFLTSPNVSNLAHVADHWMEYLSANPRQAWASASVLRYDLPLDVAYQHEGVALVLTPTHKHCAWPGDVWSGIDSCHKNSCRLCKHETLDEYVTAQLNWNVHRSKKDGTMCCVMDWEWAFEAQKARTRRKMKLRPQKINAFDQMHNELRVGYSLSSVDAILYFHGKCVKGKALQNAVNAFRAAVSSTLAPIPLFHLEIPFHDYFWLNQSSSPIHEPAC